MSPAAGDRLGARPRGWRGAAASLVLVALALGCIAFWVGVPAATLWSLGRLTDSATSHLVLGLTLVPAAIGLVFALLLRLNWLYLELTGVVALLEADELETGWHRRVAGPLVPMLLGSLVLVPVAAIAWMVLVG